MASCIIETMRRYRICQRLNHVYIIAQMWLLHEKWGDQSEAVACVFCTAQVGGSSIKCESRNIKNQNIKIKYVMPMPCIYMLLAHIMCEKFENKIIMYRIVIS